MTTVCKPFSKPLQSARRAVTKVVRGERKMGGEESKYWGMWREIARKFGWSNAQKEEMRRELTLEIFGTHKSHKVFSHGDYDVVFGAMRELLAQSQLAIFPEKIIWAYMDGEARRVAKLIDELQMPPAYIAAISRDRFGTTAWRDLLACEMHDLFITCKARKKSAERKGRTLYNNEKPAEESGYVEADPDDFPF